MMEQKERIHINLARIKKNGEMFEVDVDPDLAVRFRRGENIDIREVLRASQVFKDAQKGLVASETRMKEFFGTSNPFDVAGIIIKEGEIQLSADYREQMRDIVRKRIVEIIRRYGIDPRTKLPHPAVRIESAINEAKVKIDEHKNAEEQVQDVVRGINRVLPISFAKKDIWVHIPSPFASKTCGLVKSMGTVVREEWTTDGSWEATIEIPGGLEEELYDKLNKATHGNIITKLMGEK